MTIRIDEFEKLYTVSSCKVLTGEEKKVLKKEYMARWKKENPEKCKQYVAKWHNENPEYIARWKKENPEYDKKWRKEHPIAFRKICAKANAKRKRELGFEPINEPFEGGVWHHVNENDVMCIPEVLHRSVYHVLATGVGMEEINDLAMGFMLAELGEC